MACSVSLNSSPSVQQKLLWYVPRSRLLIQVTLFFVRLRQIAETYQRVGMFLSLELETSST